MIDRFFSNGSTNDDLRFRQYEVLRDTMRQGSSLPEHTTGQQPIVIPCEPEDIIHDGVNPCGRPGCPCEQGYGDQQQEDNTPWYTRPDVNPWTDPYWR